MSDKTIRYTSPNGYTGVLYGKRSFSIYGPDGKECMHTGFRNINTYKELVEHVDGYPEFAKMLLNVKKDI